MAKSEVEIAQPMAKPISCEQSLIDIYARRKKERRLPKSCIFFEVALAQVLRRDKPVLFLSDRFLLYTALLKCKSGDQYLNPHYQTCANAFNN